MSSKILSCAAAILFALVFVKTDQRSEGQTRRHRIVMQEQSIKDSLPAVKEFDKTLNEVKELQDNTAYQNKQIEHKLKKLDRAVSKKHPGKLRRLNVDTIVWTTAGCVEICDSKPIDTITIKPKLTFFQRIFKRKRR